MVKVKRRAVVDKRNGQYRVQVLERRKYERKPRKGQVEEEFLYKRTFNKRKDAEAFAKDRRSTYKKR